MSRGCNHHENVRRALESLNEARMVLEQAVEDGENCSCQVIEETEHDQHIPVLATHGLNSLEFLQVQSQYYGGDAGDNAQLAQYLYERGQITYPRSVAEVQRIAALDTARVLQDLYEYCHITYPRSVSELQLMIPENNDSDMAEFDKPAEN